MKKILSLFLCLAITLSFSAPVSARMLKSKDDSASSSQTSPAKKKDTTAKKDTAAKKDAAEESSAGKKVSSPTSGSTLTVIQYVTRVEAIRMTFAGDLMSFFDLLYSPTIGESAMLKEINKLLVSQDKAIADIAALKAPKEFAKASSLFKSAAKKSVTALKAAKLALKSEKESDIEKMSNSFEALSTTLGAAFAEYDRVCENL